MHFCTLMTILKGFVDILYDNLALIGLYIMWINCLESKPQLHWKNKSNDDFFGLETLFKYFFLIAQWLRGNYNTRLLLYIISTNKDNYTLVLRYISCMSWYSDSTFLFIFIQFYNSYNFKSICTCFVIPRIQP